MPDTDRTGSGPPRLPYALRLRSLKATRATFAKILRSYGRGDLDDATAKALAYLLAGYLAYLKTETEEDLEARVAALEARVKT